MSIRSLSTATLKQFRVSNRMSGAPSSVSVDILAVGGGGASTINQGTNGAGGGGGAGGFNEQTGVLVPLGVAFKVSVGAGGSAPASYLDYTGNGFGSICFTVVATGGGQGACGNTSREASTRGLPGASAGGAGANGGTTPVDGETSDSHANFGELGNNGGSSYASSTVDQTAGGGGGGSGSVGANGLVNNGGDGGSGTLSTVTGTTLAGGGGGAVRSAADTPGTGQAGGGNGADGDVAGNDGTANTGGGAGGPGRIQAGGNGGSGVCAIKYPSAYSITVGAGLTASTSEAAGYKVTTFTAGEDTVVIG